MVSAEGLEAGEVPTALVAVTATVTRSEFVRPVMVQLVVLVVHVLAFEAAEGELVVAV